MLEKLRAFGKKAADKLDQEGVFERFIVLQVERKFKEFVGQYASGMPIMEWTAMAENNMDIKQMMKDRGVAIPDFTPNPKVSYLLSMTDSKLVSLIGEVAPAHAQVLIQYPRFRRDAIQMLKDMAAGAEGGPGADTTAITPV